VRRSSTYENTLNVRALLFSFALIASSLLTACGDGGTTTGSVAPSPITAAPVSMQTVLQTSAVGGSASGNPTFVTGTGLPVYTYSLDVAGQPSKCAGPLSPVPAGGSPANCLSAWPPVSPPAGVTLTAPWSSIVNNDTKQPQLALNGLPLYTFFADTPMTATGDGVDNFHLAHPAAAAPTQAPQGPTY
jgi:predicted lipoprotein with Yx(FWY)xxD motif